MKRLSLIIIAAALFTGCVKDRDTGSYPSSNGEYVDITLTRAPGGLPELDQPFAFHLFSSKESETFTGIGTYRYNPQDNDRMFVPCRVDSRGQVNWTSVSGNAPGYVPGDGLTVSTSTVAGTLYYCHFCTPALKMAYQNDSDGTQRIRYDRTIEFSITNQTVPFRVFPYKATTVDLSSSTLKMVDMISYFTFFFREETALPIIIEDVKLYNVGTHANYHPIWKTNQVRGQGNNDMLELAVKKITPIVGPDHVAYESADTARIFPTDYRVANLLDPTLEFTLKMVKEDIGGGDPEIMETNITIPLAIDVLPSKNYQFYLEITSTLINVNYIVTPATWKDMYVEDTEIGADAGLKGTLGTFQIKNWEEGTKPGGDNDIIG